MLGNRFSRWLILVACGALPGTGHLVALECKSTAQHDHPRAEVKEHGAEAMGFDQDKTTHHFFLSKDGGVIAVEASDPKDSVNISRIQHHLALQAGNFSRGDFHAPEHTHGQLPPGVPTMQKMKDQIRYQFRKSPQGGQLRISSSHAGAVEAIHQFLKFQIQEHQTGDPTSLK
jgi:hypothetical protein